jgi:crotonobetainyl-CoA:carnitine CoA-transferase CaiB-like acyl-CoA transferase
MRIAASVSSPDQSPALPLAGVRVLDLSWLLPGPFCTHVLVDLGADVIKIERPGDGDYLRDILPATYALVNRGKRSIALDLKQAEDRALFDQLLDSADVLVEAFRPGVAARLGVDYATLSARHPRLVYASLSGYGQDGPLAHLPGHDINYLARAGALAIPAHWEEAPRRSGLPVADLAASLYAVINIMAALRVRDASGRGAHVDLAITDAVLHWSQVRFADHAQAGEAWHHVRPGNDVFRTADGALLALGLVEEKFWGNFGAACGWNEAASLARDFEQAGNAAVRLDAGNRLRAGVTAAIAARDLAHWQRVLAEHDVPFAPVHGPRDVFTEAHFVARGVVSQFKDAVTGRHIGAAAFPGGLYRGVQGAAPTLDQHGAALRAELARNQPAAQSRNGAATGE